MRNKTASTQRYLNPAIVAEKSAATDYAVSVIEIELDGECWDYVLDGHHSLAAAIQDGVEPMISTPDWARQELDALGVAGFLDAHYCGDAIYDVETGNDIF